MSHAFDVRCLYIEFILAYKYFGYGHQQKHSPSGLGRDMTNPICSIAKHAANLGIECPWYFGYRHTKCCSCCCKAARLEQLFCLFPRGLCTNCSRPCGCDRPTSCCKLYALAKFVSISSHCIQTSSLQENTRGK